MVCLPSLRTTKGMINDVMLLPEWVELNFLAFWDVLWGMGKILMGKIGALSFADLKMHFFYLNFPSFPKTQK